MIFGTGKKEALKRPVSGTEKRARALRMRPFPLYPGAFSAPADYQ
jgi:hypothetical protein